MKFPDLPIKYWGVESLSKLGSCLGVPLKTDKVTKNKEILSYARLQIDIKLNSSFPEFIDFVDERGVLVRQSVNYEWRPLKCDTCKMYGHATLDCRNKLGAKWVWRPKVPQVTEETAKNATDDGFQQVTKKMSSSRTVEVRHSPTSISTANSFRNLDPMFVEIEGGTENGQENIPSSSWVALQAGT